MLGDDEPFRLLVILSMMVPSRCFAAKKSPFGSGAEALVALQLQESQEFADLVAALGGVTHGDVGVDAVVVSTTGPFALHVAGFDQVGDDALGGSLGDSDALADITESRVRVAV